MYVPQLPMVPRVKKLVLVLPVIFIDVGDVVVVIVAAAVIFVVVTSCMFSLLL